jgi:2-amino-4-hydroxy-6-hydroxymethyldihydropteridine diphosphokinase
MAVWSRIYNLKHLYVIGLGSNQRHPVLGSPRAIIAHAFAALEMPGIDVFAVSPIMDSRPIGPSARQYANAAAILSTDLEPDDILQQLQSIEHHFGRIRKGQNWRARTLDLDILLWSSGIWVSDNPPLSIPHSQLHFRSFVLAPAASIAANWRDPLSGYAIKHLVNRINRSKPLDR